MIDDALLLRRYLDERSESAFAELVHRHMDLVYGTALRRLRGHVQRAEDVTQDVFGDLAKKAQALSGRTSLAGWLYLSTHHACGELMRSEQRRQAREEAWTMSERFESSGGGPSISDDWSRLRPALEMAMLELRPKDREAILLRFYEQRPFADVGAALRLKEDAARRRVDRALDQLRAVMDRRGLRSTAAAIAACLGAETAMAAPASLAAAVTQAAVAGAAAGSSGLGVLGFMSMSKFALGITAAVFLISTGGLMNEALKHHRIEAGLAAAQANYSTELDRVRQLERSFNAISVSAPGARRAAPQVQAPGVSPDAAEKTRALEAAHPEIQSAWQRYMQANAYQRYDGRLAELGVTPSQLDRFLQLKEGRLVMIDGPNGEPYRFMSDPLSEGLSQSDVESELQTLLGPATYQRVKDFEAAAPVRESVSAAAGLALLAGTPLSAAQANGLAQAMNDNPAEPQIENILNPGQRVIFEAVLSQRAVSAELQAAAQKAAEAPVLQE